MVKRQCAGGVGKNRQKFFNPDLNQRHYNPYPLSHGDKYPANSYRIRGNMECLFSSNAGIGKLLTLHRRKPFLTLNVNS